MTEFRVEAFHHEYLPEGSAAMSAVVTVTASGGAGAGPAPTDGVAEIIIVDTSGSMEQPSSKIRAARRATAEAIEEIRDGVWFAVIAGDNDATLVYPRSGMIEASPSTRAEAVAAAKGLDSGGGTAISTWLAMARDLFLSRPAGVRHAILLTDGKNESEVPAELDRVLESCVGVFQCDCRGVGTQWEVAELRKISSALLGTVDIIPKAEELEEAFRTMMASAMAKGVAEVSLRVWAPQGARVDFVRQVAPAIEDLTDKAASSDALTKQFPTGAWSGDESRDYHVCVDVAPGAMGVEKLAARVMLLVGDDQVGQALVRAVWTDDETLSTRISPQVAHYTGQAELAQVIQDGLEARKAGDDVTATVKLGRAVQLAHESGNDGTMRLLRKVVDVEDEATGTIRVKRNVEALDEMELDTRSTRTVRVGRATEPPVEAIP